MQQNQEFEYGGRSYKTAAHGRAMIKIGRLLELKIKPKAGVLPIQPVREPAGVRDEVRGLDLITNAQAHGLSELAGLLLDSQETIRTANVLIANLGLDIKPLLLPEISMMLAKIDRISAEAHLAACQLNMPTVRDDLRRRGLIKAIRDRRAEQVATLLMTTSKNKERAA